MNKIEQWVLDDEEVEVLLFYRSLTQDQKSKFISLLKSLKKLLM